MQQIKFKAKGIFLDLDGTIVDSTVAYLEAAKIAFHAVGKPVPSDAVMLEIPKRLELSRSLEDITLGTTDEFLPVYLDAYHSITEKETRLLPNVEVYIGAFSQKSKTCPIYHAPCPQRRCCKKNSTHTA